MKNGKMMEDGGIKIHGGVAIEDLRDLEVLMSYKIKSKKLKLKVSQDYNRRVRKTL